ncbi:UNKNOWN [Stylonychia lemnae]|uniref:Transmembrane protein n=1 Tax=Stylonychia lemnae TaxID=5949 RepID=A0A078AVT7_STYLE|nr:UNKNOWN [Stylonychia lemnae]|eukprot:CDW86201.1 UNKNOWN [Stylonychia lemnae]
MLEMKEKNKKTICLVNLISTIITTALMIGTLVILNKEPEVCKGHQLKITLWLMLGMHATNIIEQVCSMTGLDRWCCGCICILAFFFYELAVLVYMNSVFYSSGECEEDHPLKYWWLFFNIIVYFFFLFITIYFHCKSFFAAVSRDEVIKEMNEEEQEDKKAHSNTMQ